MLLACWSSKPLSRCLPPSPPSPLPQTSCILFIIVSFTPLVSSFRRGVRMERRLWLGATCIDGSGPFRWPPGVLLLRPLSRHGGHVGGRARRRRWWGAVWARFHFASVSAEPPAVSQDEGACAALGSGLVASASSSLPAPVSGSRPGGALGGGEWRRGGEQWTGRGGAVDPFQLHCALSPHR